MSRPGTWKKGQSGNPSGRPLKNRALTEILTKAGSRTREDVDGKRRNGKRIMARALWELATTGRATLPREGGVYEVEVSGDGWFDVVKWLYQHIDGPPKLRQEISGPGGGPIKTQDVTLGATERNRAVAKLAEFIATGLSANSEERDDAMGTAERPAVDGAAEPGG